jgi:hypothetical protein
VPLTFKEAMTSTESGKWKRAMDKEIESLEDNQTFTWLSLHCQRAERQWEVGGYTQLRRIVMDMTSTRPGLWLKDIVRGQG